MEPQPVQPLNYYSPDLAMPRLPGGAKAVAIIGVVLGGLGVFSVLKTLVTALAYSTNNPMVTAMTSTSFLHAWYWVTQWLNVLLVIILLSGSISLLRSKENGRLFLIVYAVVSLVLAIPGAVIAETTVFPVLQQQIYHGRATPQVLLAMNIFHAVIWGALVFSLAWNVVILLVMTRPRLKSYLAMAASGRIVR